MTAPLLETLNARLNKTHGNSPAQLLTEPFPPQLLHLSYNHRQSEDTLGRTNSVMHICFDIDCTWYEAIPSLSHSCTHSNKLSSKKEHYHMDRVTILNIYLASVQLLDLYPACRHLQSNKQMYWRKARENTTT